MGKQGLRTILLSVIGCISILASRSESQDKGISVSWGLENDRYFREFKGDGKNFPKLNVAPDHVYSFTNSESVHDRLDACTNRHFEMWEKYQNDHPNPTTRNREEFQQIKRANDPACFSYAQEVAPTLYFDFETTNDDTYILKSIEVQTLHFEEYKGGGFTDNEAWYDIVVSHKVGNKSYAIDNKLTFKNKGRAQIRLWSDNYDQYGSQGWLSPMGQYFIKITFHFTHNGTESSASTAPFQIDI